MGASVLLAHIVYFSASSVSPSSFLLFPPSVCGMFLDLVSLDRRAKSDVAQRDSELLCAVTANGSVKVGDLCF